MENIPPNAQSSLAHLPFGTDPARVGEVLVRDGGLVLEGALTQEQVAAVNRELNEAMNRLSGGNFSDGEDNFVGDFFGHKTKRLQHCIKYSQTYRECFIANPMLAEYVALIVPGAPGEHSLFSSQGIEILPGEAAQALHRDSGGFDAILGVLKPGGVNVIANTLLALTDITEEMGATRVIPGSHLWEDQENAGQPEQTIPAIMSAGDVALINGRLCHGGGANVTADRSRRVISSAFSLSFFKGEEAWPFIITLEEARSYPEPVRRMMGFHSASYMNEDPGFLWRVNTRPLEEFLGF